MSNETSMARKGPSPIPLLVALALGILLAQWLPPLWSSNPSSGGTEVEAAAEEGPLWTCGMHPHVIEDEPGQCPICGMDLTPMADSSVGDRPVVTGAESADSVESSWTCPDHPMIEEPEPGACPIDGQDLVPASPEGTTTATVRESPAVRVDPAMVQKMNVRTEKAIRRDLTRPIRTVGYLEFDPQRMVTVTTKYSGWIEKVYVNYVGQRVKKGSPLFEIYSPELVQTEEELLSALRFAQEMSSAPEDARRRAESLVQSARIRLGYWDVSDQQIERLERTGEVFRTLTVAAPASGMVMKRMAGLEGMAASPGMELFHIADLSSLWLSAELYEDQLAWVREGAEASIELAYFPGETFHGKVRYLEPELSETSRTLRAKIEIPNPQGRLRKGMYASVELRPLVVSDALTVRGQAVLRTGRRNLVVVAQGDGVFAPREVVLGHEVDGWVQVLEGLQEGAEVVVSAQFLLDSESQLRAAVQQMISERQAGSQGPGDSAMGQGTTEDMGHAGHGH